MEWWVCRECDDDDTDDEPCSLSGSCKPHRCVDMQEQWDWAEWHPATQQDMEKIAMSANLASVEAGNIANVSFQGIQKDCVTCEMWPKAMEQHICVRGKSMGYEKCAYKEPIDD